MHATLPAFTTRHLVAYAADAGDAEDVQRLFVATPSYVTAHAETLTDDLARREIEAITGRDGGRFFVLRRRTDEQAVGFLGAVIGYPRPQKAWIDRLLITQRSQRMGLGREAYLAFERWVRTESPEVEIMLGQVKRGFRAGLGFWTALGFHRVEMCAATWEGRTCDYWTVKKELE